MSRLDARIELAALAHRRYPDMPLDLAVRCLESDRRHAGLGALDEKKRSVGGEVSNYKRDTFGRVLYHLVRKSPPRLEYPRMRMKDWAWTVASAETTIQLVEVPGRDQHLCVPADYRDLRDQEGRLRIAAALREARRMLRLPSDGKLTDPSGG